MGAPEGYLLPLRVPASVSRQADAQGLLLSSMRMGAGPAEASGTTGSNCRTEPGSMASPTCYVIPRRDRSTSHSIERGTHLRIEEH